MWEGYCWNGYNFPETSACLLKSRNKSGCGIPPLRASENTKLLTNDDAEAKLFTSMKGNLEWEQISRHTKNTVSQLESLCCTRSGWDLPEVCKAMATGLAKLLNPISWPSLNSGWLSMKWNFGVLKLIFRGGDSESRKSYRSICLTLVISKSVETLVKNYSPNP